MCSKPIEFVVNIIKLSLSILFKNLYLFNDIICLLYIFRAGINHSAILARVYKKVQIPSDVGTHKKTNK